MRPDGAACHGAGVARCLALLLLLVLPGCATQLVWHAAGLDGRSGVAVFEEAAAVSVAGGYVVEVVWSDGEQDFVRLEEDAQGWRGAAAAGPLPEGEQVALPQQGWGGRRPEAPVWVDATASNAARLVAGDQVLWERTRHTARLPAARRLWVLLLPAALAVDVPTFPLQLVFWPIPYTILLWFGAADMM